MIRRAILTTGGTGGHVFPALSVAEELRRRCPEAELLFVGGAYGPEGDMARKAGLSFVALPVRGVLGRGLRAVGAAAMLARGVMLARGILKDFKPQVVARFGKVHVLVNNAGVGVTGPVKEATYDDWDWGMDVNLGGVLNGIIEFMPRLNSHGEGGHIINTSSMAAVVPMRVAAIYITAKSAVLGLSEVLRGELAADGISVSAFCPGPVQTNIAASGELRPDKYKSKSGLMQYEKNLANRPNSPHWMTMEEVGERVLQGLLNDDLFIFTHREFREGFAERCKKMLDSFPDEEINRERYEDIKWLTENPIYRE